MIGQVHDFSEFRDDISPCILRITGAMVGAKSAVFIQENTLNLCSPSL